MNRITFSIPTESDFDNVWRYSSDEDVTKYLTWNKYEKLRDFETFFKEQYLKNLQFPNFFRTISSDSRFAGTLHMLVRKRDTLQIGFGLLPEFWGRRVGSIVLDNVCQMIVDQYPKIRTIQADVNRDNVAMIKMIESYGFQRVQDLGENRISYECKTDTIRFKLNLFLDERIEAVFEVGNLNKGVFSDYDYIIAFYEEGNISHFITELREKSVYVLDNPSPYHYFLKSEYGEIFDIYLIASSFVHAMFNVTKNIFDKSAFLSSKLKKDPSQGSLVNYDEMYVFYITKILDKFSSGKLVHVFRIFVSLRDNVIVPMAKKYGYAKAENITDISWQQESLLYDAYKATYVELDNEKMQYSIRILYDVILTLLPENSHLTSQMERMKKNVEWL